MTLGRSPEPLKKSIAEYKPDRIIFLASHDSIPLSGEIIKSLDYSPQVKYEITDDPNLMFECYRKACRCVSRVKKADVSPKEVMVDYTGGTKH